jgi:hypothetical protein
MRNPGVADAIIPHTTVVSKFPAVAVLACIIRVVPVSSRPGG